MENKKTIARFTVLSFLVLIISWAFCNIRIYENGFLFIIPFVLFCFLNGKLYGAISCVGACLFFAKSSDWFYLFGGLVVITLTISKYFLKGSSEKVARVTGFLAFFLVLLGGFFSNVIYSNNYFFMSFIIAVVGYWVMRFFYEIYVSVNLSEDSYFLPKESAFITFVLGVIMLGLNMKFFQINLSFIIVILIAIIASKIDFELSVVYSFLIVVIAKVLNVSSFSFALLFGVSILVSLLNKTSKLVLVFSYILGIIFLEYYFNFSYYECLNYCLAIIVYLLIPSRIIKRISKKMYGSEMYINKIKEENKSYNLNVSNKILKMGEIFSIVCGKLKIDERIRVSDKKLMIDEINVFNELIKNYSVDIKENYNFKRDYKIEKELYKAGFDVLYVNVIDDIVWSKKIKIGIRCTNGEIKNTIIPLVNEVFKSNFIVDNFKNNDIFDFKQIVLKEKKTVGFEYAVSQKAKDGLVCGDSYLVYENNEKKLFALSDGMGCGKEAKKRSKVALDLLKKFMDIGFEEHQTLRSINCVLKKEYYKDGYATLDLLIYDKKTSKLYFSKNGACNSYLIKGDNICEIEGNNLPLGIIDKINFEFKEIDCESASIIMVSDGVDEIAYSKLKKVKGANLQKLSKELVKGEKDIIDDKTVMIIEIKNKKNKKNPINKL